jgi:hypothetical protein
MAVLSPQELTALAREGTLTFRDVLDTLQAREGLKPSVASKISAFRNSIEAGFLGYDLDGNYMQALNDDSFVRKMSGLDLPDEMPINPADNKRFRKSKRLGSFMPVDAFTDLIFTSQGFRDFPKITGKGGAAVASTGVQTQDRTKKPMRGLIPAAEVDKVYLAAFQKTKRVKSGPSKGAEIPVFSADDKLAFMFQRATMNRVEHTFPKSANEAGTAIKMSDITVDVNSETGKRFIIIQGVESGTEGQIKKKRNTVKYEGVLGDLLIAFYEKRMAEVATSGNPNMPFFTTTRSRAAKLFNDNIAPTLNRDFEPQLPFDSGKNRGHATLGTVRSISSRIYQTELNIPNELRADMMGHQQGGISSRSYSGQMAARGMDEIGAVAELGLIHSAGRAPETNTVNDYVVRFLGTDNTPLSITGEGGRTVDGRIVDFRTENADVTGTSVLGRSTTPQDAESTKAAAERYQSEQRTAKLASDAQAARLLKELGEVTEAGDLERGQAIIQQLNDLGITEAPASQKKPAAETAKPTEKKTSFGGMSDSVREKLGKYGYRFAQAAGKVDLPMVGPLTYTLGAGATAGYVAGKSGPAFSMPSETGETLSETYPEEFTPLPTSEQIRIPLEMAEATLSPLPMSARELYEQREASEQTDIDAGLRMSMPVEQPRERPEAAPVPTDEDSFLTMSP